MSKPIISTFDSQDRYIQEVWNHMKLSKRIERPEEDLKDGCLVAEFVHKFIPELVDLEDYPTALDSEPQAHLNWLTLNRKVFRNLGFSVDTEHLKDASRGLAGVVQRITEKLQTQISFFISKRLHKQPASQPPTASASLEESTASFARLDPTSSVSSFIDTSAASIAPSQLDEDDIKMYERKIDAGHAAVLANFDQEVDRYREHVLSEERDRHVRELEAVPTADHALVHKRHQEDLLRLSSVLESEFLEQRRRLEHKLNATRAAKLTAFQQQQQQQQLHQQQQQQQLHHQQQQQQRQQQRTAALISQQQLPSDVAEPTPAALLVRPQRWTEPVPVPVSVSVSPPSAPTAVSAPAAPQPFQPAPAPAPAPSSFPAAAAVVEPSCSSEEEPLDFVDGHLTVNSALRLCHETVLLLEGKMCSLKVMIAKLSELAHGGHLGAPAAAAEPAVEMEIESSPEAPSTYHGISRTRGRGTVGRPSQEHDREGRRSGRSKSSAKRRERSKARTKGKTVKLIKKPAGSAGRAMPKRAQTAAPRLNLRARPGWNSDVIIKPQEAKEGIKRTVHFQVPSAVLAHRGRTQPEQHDSRPDRTMHHRPSSATSIKTVISKSRPKSAPTKRAVAAGDVLAEFEAFVASKLPPPSALPPRRIAAFH